MDNAVPDKVHWFSIINSMLIVLFLSVMIIMIMIRNLHRDITRYNRVLTEEEKNEEREESGWKLVHGDVFRAPTPAPMMFAVFIGTGLQLLCMAVITIAFAAVGFLSPANRGSLVIAVLVLYVMIGAVAGYSSARLYKTFKGKEWQKCTMYTAFLFPGICFLVFVGFNIILSFYHSTAAIPMLSLVALVVSPRLEFALCFCCWEGAGGIMDRSTTRFCTLPLGPPPPHLATPPPRHPHHLATPRPCGSASAYHSSSSARSLGTSRSR